jgi:hypothetical protein
MVTMTTSQLVPLRRLMLAVMMTHRPQVERPT